MLVFDAWPKQLQLLEAGRRVRSETRSSSRLHLLQSLKIYIASTVPIAAGSIKLSVWTRPKESSRKSQWCFRGNRMSRISSWTGYHSRTSLFGVALENPVTDEEDEVMASLIKRTGLEKISPEIGRDVFPARRNFRFWSRSA